MVLSDLTHVISTKPHFTISNPPTATAAACPPKPHGGGEGGPTTSAFCVLPSPLFY